jgi:hypothetical protein
VLQSFKTEVAQLVAALEIKMVRDYALKDDVAPGLDEDVQRLETKLSSNVRDLHTKIDVLTGTMQSSFRGVERSLGLIEGKLSESHL